MGHPNVPPPECVVNLRHLVQSVLDPLRAELGPIRVTSGYRSPDVNRAIGGSSTSQHVSGQAADIVLVHDHDARQVAEVLFLLDLEVDQVIWYAPEVGGHVHVSHARHGRNRRQFLHCFRENGEKRYRTYRPSSSIG
jgi:uncharacterized protein YcbK (DUF882 family)